MDSRSRGAWGEDQAADYLRTRGYVVLARNYRCRYGEVDLIVSQGGYLAFVEVKLRRSSQYGTPGEAVTYAKQKKLRTTALTWLAEHPTRLQPRFDVIEILAPLGEATAAPQINHIINAF